MQFYELSLNEYKMREMIIPLDIAGCIIDINERDQVQMGKGMRNSERWHKAEIRVLAKKFKARIPTNMAIPIPDDIIDKLKDVDIPYFFDCLASLGLQQKNERHHWEKI